MKAYAPNGAEIRGTVEFSVSYANTEEDSFLPDKGNGVSFEWTGETESFYHDGQTTVTRGDETLFEDENSDAWKGSRLILVDGALDADDPRIDADATPDTHHITDAAPILDALDTIRKERDFHADHGRYSASGPSADQCFDDWAADIAAPILKAHGRGE